MGNVKRICHTCGGLGKEGGCPKCGLTPRKRTEVQTLHLDVPADVIPLPYQGNLWTKPELGENATARMRDFDDKLERVAQEFMSGRIPKFSMFISSPAKYGKHAFAYTCLQTALAQQFTIAPLFTTSDWRRLYRVSQMNPFYKLYDSYKWDDLIKRDVVFITVDHSEDRYDVISLLKDIYDIRSTFSFPTFVISDFRLEELVPRWGAENYSLIYNPDPKRDFNRYPVVLSRFD